MHTGGFLLLGPAMRMLYYRSPRNSALLTVPNFGPLCCAVACVPLYIESPCACRYVHRICETKRAKLRINSGDNEQSVG